MTPEQIVAELQRLVAEGTAVMARWEGTKKLFDAACMQGNGIEADKLRHELHAILDVLLDTTSSTISLRCRMFNRADT